MEEQTEYDGFMNSTSFHHKIEDMVEQYGISYLEAVLKFCEENDREPEDIKKMLTVTLKDKIKIDAINAGYMMAGSSLPI